MDFVTQKKQAKDEGEEKEEEEEGEEGKEIEEKCGKNERSDKDNVRREALVSKKEKNEIVIVDRIYIGKIREQND